jgi:flagellar motor switch protein FliN/FliY
MEEQYEQQQGATKQGVDVQQHEFNDLKEENKQSTERDIDFLLDIPIEITVRLGSTKMLIKELLQLGQGSVVELDKLAGEPMEILANSRLVARGEVVVVNEKFGIRLTDIISPSERLTQLK